MIGWAKANLAGEEKVYFADEMLNSVETDIVLEQGAEVFVYDPHNDVITLNFDGKEHRDVYGIRWFCQKCGVIHSGYLGPKSNGFVNYDSKWYPPDNWKLWSPVIV